MITCALENGVLNFTNPITGADLSFEVAREDGDAGSDCALALLTIDSIAVALKKGYGKAVRDCAAGTITPSACTANCKVVAGWLNPTVMGSYLRAIPANSNAPGGMTRQTVHCQHLYLVDKEMERSMQKIDAANINKASRQLAVH